MSVDKGEIIGWFRSGTIRNKQNVAKWLLSDQFDYDILIEALDSVDDTGWGDFRARWECGIWSTFNRDREVSFVDSLDFLSTDDGLPVTFYKRPNGTPQVINVTNIRQEDVDFFVANCVNVSMEDTNIGIVLYAAHPEDEEGDKEVITFVGGDDAPASFSRLRKQYEKLLEELTNER